MEEYQITYDKGETTNLINFPSIQISQDEIKYELNIISDEDSTTLSINEEIFPFLNFTKRMNLKELKNLNKEFYNLKSIIIIIPTIPYSNNSL